MSVLTEIPDFIWLQFYGDSEPDDDPIDSEDVTWCADQIFKHDVQYVRADSFGRTINNMRLVAHTWEGKKRETLLAFAQELINLTNAEPEATERREEVKP